MGGGIPSDYLVSTQLQLWLFCCWGCGCCWAVTVFKSQVVPASDLKPSTKDCSTHFDLFSLPGKNSCSNVKVELEGKDPDFFHDENCSTVIVEKLPIYRLPLSALPSLISHWISQEESSIRPLANLGSLTTHYVCAPVSQQGEMLVSKALSGEEEWKRLLDEHKRTHPNACKQS